MHANRHRHRERERWHHWRGGSGGGVKKPKWTAREMSGRESITLRWRIEKWKITNLDKAGYGKDLPDVMINQR